MDKEDYKIKLSVIKYVDVGNGYSSKNARQLELMNKNLFTNDEIKYLKIISLRATTMKELSKVHKEDKPITPLVHFTTAHTYKITTKRYIFIRQYNTQLRVILTISP